MSAILAVNAGSSSLKLALFDADKTSLPRIAHETFEELEEDEARRTAVLEGIGDWCRGKLGGDSLVAAGHRVVHGGMTLVSPVVVDDSVLGRIEALVPLAPLHQPHCVAPIRALRASHPSLPQVACFDTAFHAGRPSALTRYGLPDSLWQQGIRRYGFHGLSYEYVVGAFRALAPKMADGRLVIAHLGSGASLCAVCEGRSIDTTMGFSTLGGIVMGTRPGELDPGVVLHLLREGRSVEETERLLYRESGLRGISGTTAQMRELVEEDTASAREAIETFVVSIQRALGSMIAMLGGIDALIFTAGIGEHAAAIRERVCAAAAWTGLVFDPKANSVGGPRISVPHSGVSAWVVATDEERMIAQHTARLLS